MKKISDKTNKIALSVKGKNISSEELTSKINNLGLTHASNITVLINANILPNETLSLSPIDMDLGLQTDIIFEQIYRSYRILNNQAYNK